MRKIFILSLFVLSSLNLCQAESYKVSLEGEKLKGLAALEIKLAIEPQDSFLLKEEVKIFCSSDNGEELKDEALLYKFVDPQNALVRLFFREPLEVRNLFIEGELDRVNFSGQADIKIAEVNYISDFARDVNPEKIDEKIEITEDRDLLPFLGISKASILGPRKIIYRPKIFVAISGIETYGFKFGSNITMAKINGVEARIINDEIVSAKLSLPQEQAGKVLEIILDIEVDNKIVSKSVGNLKIVETVQ